MRLPLWIINSTLLLLLIVCLYVVLLLQPKIPQATSLLPKDLATQAINTTPVNLKSIYEDDIFKTHISSQEEIFDLEKNITIPQPPAYQDSQIEVSDKPVFLEPLPISITGIMTFASEEHNRVMIRDLRDQVERAYHIGDEIQDAQILRILPNKVLIIRTNSQQETLFLREQDVIADLDSIEPDWTSLVSSPEQNKYVINRTGFAEHVKNLGNFVDMLNLITAYQNGISTGVKVGSNATNPIIAQLGLQSGDVFTKINGLELNSTQGRLQVYNLITSEQTDTLSVVIIRDKQEIELTYILAQKTPVIVNNAAEVQAHISKNQAQFERINDKIKAQDRNHIAQFKNKISQSVSG